MCMSRDGLADDDAYMRAEHQAWQHHRFRAVGGGETGVPASAQLSSTTVLSLRAVANFWQAVDDCSWSMEDLDAGSQKCGCSQ